MLTLTLLALATVLIWVFLLLGRHGFWRAHPRLEPIGEAAGGAESEAPPIAVIIPARDEAETIEAVVRSLLAQDYAGRLELYVVDDQSRDRTAAIVDELISEATPRRQLRRLRNSDRPAGWSGKLWAIKAGLDHLAAEVEAPAILLLTDADIAHDPTSLTALYQKMVNDNLDLVSVMVQLRRQSFWESLLIPPFVFFFRMLYPFNAVNEAASPVAAAAGGCVLLRREALCDAGGIEAIGGTLIDDVALGKLIKFRPGGERRIWLGHAERTVSLRPYESLGSIWQMVVRTADTQLGHSLLKLIGTVAGMVSLYLLPMLAVLAWPLHQDIFLGLLGLVGWVLMAVAFWPTLSLYHASVLWAPTLPVAACFYTAMTIDSARRYRQGKGGVWKGRAFQP